MIEHRNFLIFENYLREDKVIPTQNSIEDNGDGILRYFIDAKELELTLQNVYPDSKTGWFNHFSSVRFFDLATGQDFELSQNSYIQFNYYDSDRLNLFTFRMNGLEEMEFTLNELEKNQKVIKIFSNGILIGDRFAIKIKVNSLKLKAIGFTVECFSKCYSVSSTSLRVDKDDSLPFIFSLEGELKVYDSFGNQLDKQNSKNMGVYSWGWTVKPNDNFRLIFDDGFCLFSSFLNVAALRGKGNILYLFSNGNEHDFEMNAFNMVDHVKLDGKFKNLMISHKSCHKLYLKENAIIDELVLAKGVEQMQLSSGKSALINKVNGNLDLVKFDGELYGGSKCFINSSKDSKGRLNNVILTRLDKKEIKSLYESHENITLNRRMASERIAGLSIHDGDYEGSWIDPIAKVFSFIERWVPYLIQDKVIPKIYWLFSFPLIVTFLLRNIDSIDSNFENRSAIQNLSFLENIERESKGNSMSSASYADLMFGISYFKMKAITEDSDAGSFEFFEKVLRYLSGFLFGFLWKPFRATISLILGYTALAWHSKWQGWFMYKDKEISMEDPIIGFWDNLFALLSFNPLAAFGGVPDVTFYDGEGFWWWGYGGAPKEFGAFLVVGLSYLLFAGWVRTVYNYVKGGKNG